MCDLGYWFCVQVVCKEVVAAQFMVFFPFCVFFSLLFSISVIIPATKTVAFPRDSGKVPLAMHFFGLLSLGNMSEKLD